MLPGTGCHNEATVSVCVKTQHTSTVEMVRAAEMVRDGKRELRGTQKGEGVFRVRKCSAEWALDAHSHLPHMCACVCLTQPLFSLFFVGVCACSSRTQKCFRPVSTHDNHVDKGMACRPFPTHWLSLFLLSRF